MQVHVRLFASLRESVGQDHVVIEIPEGITVQELVQHVVEQFPALRGAASAIYAAVNNRYVSPTTVLQAGDEVSLFPPVSGGFDGGQKLYEITESPLSLDDVVARVVDPACGAVATFVGVVRGITGEQRTSHLEYEAHPEMAEVMLAQIGEEIAQKWPRVSKVSIVHRIGRMMVGEPSVIIAVSAPHRDDGVFEACRYAIERIKTIVPIWKKEVLTDGAYWVEGPREAPPGLEDVETPTPIVERDDDVDS